MRRFMCVAAAVMVAASAAASVADEAFADRPGEITNPDDSTIVFLYYDMTGLKPPIDTWVENDARVRSAPAPAKQATREQVRAELESGAAAAKGIGLIRLSMRANLSEYDPSYGEFTVRALAPSSVVTFKKFDQQIALKFGNAAKAQTWSVPQADSQAIRDKIRSVGDVSVDVLVKVARVQPAPGGGSITANVVEYELRDGGTGTTVGRVKVAN